MIIARPPPKKQDCNLNRKDLTRLHVLDDLNSRPPRDKESARLEDQYRAPMSFRKGDSCTKANDAASILYQKNGINSTKIRRIIYA